MNRAIEEPHMSETRYGDIPIVDLTDVPLDDPRHPEYEPPAEPIDEPAQDD